MKQTTPAATPMITAGVGPTKPEAGVMATKPATAPDAMPSEWAARAGVADGPRAAADYIAGMTDRFALGEYRRLFDPDANLL